MTETLPLVETAVPEWKQVIMGDVASLTAGGTPSTSNPEYWNGAIPWMASGDVHKKRIKNVAGRITEQGLQSSSAKWMPAGSVLVALAGQGKTRGAVALSEIALTTNQSIAALVPDVSRLDAGYLFYNLGARYQELRSLSSGDGRAGLNLQILRNVRLLLPPLPEQRSIAEILTSVDGSLEAADTVIARLGEVKRGLMQQLLTKGLPGRHTAFKPSEVGEVPEGWEVKAIGAAGRVNAGRQRSPHFTEGQIRPYLRVANVFDGYIKTSDVLEMNFTDKEFEIYRLRAGDVLLNEGQSIELVGRAAMYRGDPPKCAFQNTLVRFRAFDDTDPEFALRLFQYLQDNGRFAAIAKRTTSIAHLGVSRFAELKAAFPPKEEQQEIVSVLSSLEQRIEAERFKKARLETLKRGLMQQLLTGKLRVPMEAEREG